MLVSFSVANFKSFRTKETLSLRASSLQKHKNRIITASNTDILKFTSIYGSNASGKSNIIKAIDFCAFFMQVGTIIASKSFTYRLDSTYENIPSLFDFDIEIKNKIYNYGFSVMMKDKAILEEHLYEYGYQDKLKPIFIRDTVSQTFEYDSKLLNKDNKARFQMNIEDYKDIQTNLFLTEIVKSEKKALYAEDSKLLILRDIFDWFRKLNITFPRTPVNSFSQLSNISYTEKIEERISEYATGITSIKLINQDKDAVFEHFPRDEQKKLEEKIESIKQKANNEKAGITLRTNRSLVFIEIDKDGTETYKEIIFYHNNCEADFVFGDESDGTRRLIDLLSVLISNENNRVYIIDEIDRSLHPAITTKFIDQFMQLASEMNIQLIVTTHETHLMDLKKIRKDEINFIEKDSDGGSHIKSLADMDVRGDKVIEPAYFAGDYGAILTVNEESTKYNYDEDSGLLMVAEGKN